MTCSILRNGTLIIDKSVAKDEGQYLCQARNGVGEGISKLAEVTINGKNYIKYLSNQIIYQIRLGILFLDYHNHNFS